MASPRNGGLIAVNRVARHTIKYQRMACKYQWTPLECDIEVFSDANFAGCTCTEKVHSWRSRDVERSVCEIVVQNDGSSGPE